MLLSYSAFFLKGDNSTASDSYPLRVLLLIGGTVRADDLMADDDEGWNGNAVGDGDGGGGVSDFARQRAAERSSFLCRHYSKGVARAAAHTSALVVDGGDSNGWVACAGSASGGGSTAGSRLFI